MGNSIFSVGLSGLYAAQAGLLTASHNIANASTPGYSRQQVLQGTATPQFTGAGYLGQGTRIETVRRVYDEFLTTRVRQTQASSSELATYATHAAALDAMFGDAKSGLTPMVSQFFSGLNGVAANPSDIAARQVMLTSGQALAGRFNDMASELAAQRTGLNAQITGAVSEINTLAGAIASLNEEIGLAFAVAGTDRPPNDLLDRRNALLADLNVQAGATAVTQADGSLNVYLGNGEPLVVGTQAYRLEAVRGNDDPQNLEVGLRAGTSTVTFAPGTLQGGILGGALAFRREVLDAAQDRLGGMAVALASAFNAQHALGQDLNGQPGGAFFTTPSPSVQGALTNTGTATVGATVADATALTGSNYRLAYDGTNYTLTRLADAATQTFASLPQTVDGLTLAVPSGAPAAGDAFLIQPARNAARDLHVALSDLRAIAAAAPIRTGASLANTGSGTISGGRVDATYLASPLASTVTLTFNAGTGSFSGFPATEPVTVSSGGTSTTYPAGSPVPYTAGATLAFGGISVELRGSPANGDTFTLGPNTAGTGDGRNAVLLGGLANRAGLVNGTSSLAEANGELASFVGSMAHQAQVAADAGEALFLQAETAQQSLSGVNLDEEAAALQRYQQAYQAAGKVMAIADSMFRSILDIMN